MSAECTTENIPPGYKQTEVGVIPEDWDDQKLEDIVKDDSPICYGIVQVGSYTANGVPVLAIKNLNSDYTTNIHHASVEVERPYLRSRVFPEDVIISVKGTTGRIGIVPLGFHGNISRDLARLHLRQGIVPKFIFQMLQSNLMQQHLGVAVVGTTRMELSISILKKIRIPLPPTKVEQEAIAEALSDADALIESLEQLIAKKRQIKQGAMQELLTGKRRLPGFGEGKGYKQTEVGSIPEDWNCLESSSVASYFGGNAFKSEDATTSGVSWLKIANVGKRKIEWAETSFLPLSFINEYKAYLLQAGDVVMALTRPILDSELKIARLTSCDVPCLLNQRVAKVIAKSNADLGFIYYILQTPHFVESMNEEMAGTDPPNIGSRSLGKILISVPSTISEQEAIANVLFDIDSEITALEEKLTKARQIKQGMMQELLTGRIRLV